MAIDPILAQVRRAREELAQRFNYDLRAMIQDAKDRQATSGHRVVLFPPKPAKRTIAIKEAASAR